MRVASSSAAAMSCAGSEPSFRLRRWQDGGMPVIGSRRVFSWAIVQAGEMRRSDDDVSERINRGTSLAVCSPAIVNEVAISVRGSIDDRAVAVVVKVAFRDLLAWLVLACSDTMTIGCYYYSGEVLPRRVAFGGIICQVQNEEKIVHRT